MKTNESIELKKSIELRKSIEFNIISEILRLYDMGMEPRTAINLIRDLLWNNSSTLFRDATKDIKSVKEMIEEAKHEASTK